MQEPECLSIDTVNSFFPAMPFKSQRHLVDQKVAQILQHGFHFLRLSSTPRHDSSQAQCLCGRAHPSRLLCSAAQINTPRTHRILNRRRVDNRNACTPCLDDPLMHNFGKRCKYFMHQNVKTFLETNISGAQTERTIATKGAGCTAVHNNPAMLTACTGDRFERADTKEQRRCTELTELPN